MNITITVTRPRPGETLHAAAHRLLETAARHQGIPVPLTLAEQPGGKPFCPDHPGFHFNLSHSGGWAVCAVADCPVGVDVQEERPFRPALLNKFSPWERSQLEERPQATFFDLWALKEAGAKCTGRCGMPGVLHGSEVTLDPVSLGMAGVQGALLPFPVPELHLAVAAVTAEPLALSLTLVEDAP